VYNSGLSCGSVSRAIDQATADGAAVINMSFGFNYPCHTLYVAVTGSAGASVMVASGGNEFEQGNAPIWPGSWPHVLTVAAVDSQLHSALFSNENAGIDLAAPG
jgi:subtilisin family serine protease